jgi:hypothetical protein
METRNGLSKRTDLRVAGSIVIAGLFLLLLIPCTACAETEIIWRGTVRYDPSEEYNCQALGDNVYGDKLASIIYLASRGGDFDYHFTPYDYFGGVDGIITDSIEGVDREEHTHFDNEWVYYGRDEDGNYIGAWLDPSVVEVNDGDTWYGDYCRVYTDEDGDWDFDPDDAEYRVIIKTLNRNGIPTI